VTGKKARAKSGDRGNGRRGKKGRGVGGASSAQRGRVFKKRGTSNLQKKNGKGIVERRSEENKSQRNNKQKKTVGRGRTGDNLPQRRNCTNDEEKWCREREA